MRRTRLNSTLLYGVFGFTFLMAVISLVLGIYSRSSTVIWIAGIALTISCFGAVVAASSGGSKGDGAR